MKLRFLTLLALFSFAVSLFAQTPQTSQTSPTSQVPCCATPSLGSVGKLVADVSPYGGYVWPGNFGGIGDFKGSQIYGVRGGFFITSGFEIGGNYYYNNHFQPRRANGDASLAGVLGFPQGAVRANLWEPEFTYNFGQRALFGSSVRPYAVVGAGGLTAHIQKGADQFVLNTRLVPTVKGPMFVANDVMENNNTWFTVSYGGGVKLTRLWGPMGFFGDFRGRTLANFFGHANTWPELSAGLNFAWGEK